MKFLVTGCAGFLGSNICLRLLNKGHEVIGLDNLSTGRKSNMLEFMYNPLFHFIIHDITEPFPAANVDVIVHCAVSDLKDPLHFLKTCSYGTFNVAGMARRNNAKLICITNYNTYNEKTKNIRDTLFSGFQIMEEILNNYKTLDVRIIKVFNAYGSKSPKNSYVHTLVKDISDKKELKLPVSPMTPINFCYIKDIIDGIACAIDIDKSKFNSPITLGSETVIPLEDFVNIIIKETKSKCNVSYLSDHIPKDIGNIPNIIKAKKILHWSQKIDYAKGISLYVEFLNEGRNNVAVD